MNTLYDILNKAVLRAKFSSFTEFLIEHDPKARGSQTHIKKMTGVPPEARLRGWAKALGMSDRDTDIMLDRDDVERVYAAAKKNKSLGKGLAIILSRLKDADATIKRLEVDRERIESERDGLKARLQALEKRP